MKILLIYGCLMAAGIVLGYKSKRFAKESKGRSMFQTACLLVMLFLLGHQLGGNQDVAASMTSMGLIGLILCLSAMAGSFVVVLLLRKVLEGPKSPRSGEEDAR